MSSVSVHSQVVRANYLKEVLGVQSVLVSPVQSAKAITHAADNTTPELKLEYQTFNEGPFLFLEWSDLNSKLNIEEFQLLEKIIVALKIPFEKTSIALVQTEKSLLSLSQIVQATRGYSFVFLMGGIWSEYFQLKFGQERVLDNQTFYLTYDLKSLLENAENKKNAWNQFKLIISKLQNYL
jgi:hypothetical protein